MAKPITEVLGELPSGKVVPFSFSDLGAHLRAMHLENQGEHERQKLAKERLDLYHDRGQRLLESMIDDVFSHPEVRQERKKFLKYAQFQNVSKRIVDEISTVYAESAVRFTSEAQQDRYDELQSLVGMDAKMRVANRYVNLLNSVVVWFHVRTHDGVPELRIITPDRFFAVSHPMDPLRLVGLIFSVKRQGVNVKPDEAHWQLWTDFETVQIDGNSRIMSETYVEHGLGRIPGVLVHKDPPVDQLLDYSSGRDLVSAHKAVCLLNVMMLKEQKSGTRQPYIAGDIGNTATGQPLDSESLTVFQDGVAPGVLELGADPKNYIESARSVIMQVANNYGIPESVWQLTYQSTSGFEIRLKRSGLMEKRHQQIMNPWRPTERSLAEVMHTITAQFAPEYQFDLDGWHIDFGEIDTPIDEQKDLAIKREKRAMGLITTVDMLMDQNPDLNRQQAEQMLQANIVTEQKRVELMRALQRLSGAPAEPAPSLPQDELMLEQADA